MFSSRTQWSRAPNRLHTLAAARRGTDAFFDLTESNPTRCGFNYPEAELLAALAQPAALRYAPQPLGLEAARAAVCSYYRDRGPVLDPDRLVLTASTSEAYTLLFRLLCDTGDAATMPTPSYPLFEMLARANDVVLESVPMSYHAGWEMDPARLAAAGPRTRAVLLVHPSNPAGNYVSQAAWWNVQELAAARGWAVVVDEVFFDYPVADGAARELDLASAPALTFVLNGLSKLAGLPQMKLAWIAVFGPHAVRIEALARLEILNDLYLSVDAPVQHALPAILALRHGLQDQIRNRVRANLRTLDTALASHPSMQRLQLEGGWNAVLRLPRILSDTEWAERILEQAGVLVHPGHFYEFGLDACLVLSLLPPVETFAEAVRRIVAVAAHALT
ncbi:MAG: pyridoxal phosphate-dependent aminotransferase [Terriglobales bacterium]